MSKIGFDRISLADAQTKITAETDSELTLNAVIAREMVQPYEEGRAYKPADELEKAAWTADGRWIIPLQHPASGLLTRREDISGRMSNIKFVKDLIDPKTKRPMIRGIKADLTFYKDKTPKLVLDALRDRSMSDVSIGFTYEEDFTPGEFNGEKYDFVQRNIFIDHLCAPTEIGRCPTPLCGIGVDSVLPGRKIAGDPWEETEQYIRSGHKDPNDYSTCRTMDISVEKGIKALDCKRKDNGKWEIQSFLFDVKKWTMAEAKAWFAAHKDTVDSVTACPITAKLKELKEEGFVKLLKERLSNEELSRLLAPSLEASKAAGIPPLGDPAVVGAAPAITSQPLGAASSPQPPDVKALIEQTEQVMERAKRLNK